MLHALHVLHGLAALDGPTLARASRDPAPTVRAQAALLAGDAGFGENGPWSALAEDGDPEVRFAVARVVNHAPAALRGDLIAALVRRGPRLVRGLALHASAGLESTLATCAGVSVARARARCTARA